MKRFKYRSKNDHVAIELDVKSPKEVKTSVKQCINKFKNWLHTPKGQRKKLVEIEIETDKTHKSGVSNMAITEAQKRATYRYRAKNKEKALYINKRSTTKNFILKLATSEDLADIRKYVAQRQAELNNQ